MADTSMSFRAAFWTELNLLGRIGLVLYLLLWMGLIIPESPFQWLRGRDPAVVHYLLCVLLLMIDVPLAWTAWKSLRRAQSGGKSRRALIAICLLVLLVTVVEGRLTLVKGESWTPNTGGMLMLTLFLFSMGVGRLRYVAPVSERAREESGL